MTDTVTAPRPRIQAPASAVAATSGAALDEAIALTRKLKLPHIRRALAEIVPVAKAQRWDPAEVVRALLAEEAAGRDASNLRTRRQRAAFPTGKTFHIWNEDASSIPAPPNPRCAPWNGSAAARTSASSAHQAPASHTSAKPSARPQSTPG